jgi:transposase
MLESKKKRGRIYKMSQRTYTSEFRANAVKLAEEIGASDAARELKMPSDTLYTWISRAKSGDLPMNPIALEPKKVLNMAERVKELEKELKAVRSENIQIKRENVILEEAAAFFASRRKKSGSV